MTTVPLSLPAVSTTSRLNQPELESNRDLQNLQRKLAELIGEVMTLLAQEKDQMGIVRLQERYTIAVIHVADLKRADGRLGVYAAVATLAGIFATLPVDPKERQVVLEVASKIIGAVQGLLHGKYGAEERREEGEITLRGLEIQDKVTRSQGENNAQEKLLQTLQQLQQLINSAAASSGG